MGYNIFGKRPDGRPGPIRITTEGDLLIGLASDVALTVAGTTAIAAGSLTRPADTTAYTAGDGVTTATSAAAAMILNGAARIAGGSGVIIGGRAIKNTTTTANAQFRVWLYQDATGVAIPNDNAAFSPPIVADRLRLIGRVSVDFAAVGAVVGSDGIAATLTLERTPMAYKLASGTSILAIWEARAAYAPGSAETFHLLVDTLQD